MRQYIWLDSSILYTSCVRLPISFLAQSSYLQLVLHYWVFTTLNNTSSVFDSKFRRLQIPFLLCHMPVKAAYEFSIQDDILSVLLLQGEVLQISLFF